MNLQSVGADAEEVFDAQILFQGLEGGFYSPAAFLNAGDGGCGGLTVVGEKYQGALVRLVPELDATQEQVVLAAAGQFVKKDDLIALGAASAFPMHGLFAAIHIFREGPDRAGERHREPIRRLVGGKWNLALPKLAAARSQSRQSICRNNPRPGGLCQHFHPSFAGRGDAFPHSLSDGNQEIEPHRARQRIGKVI